MMQKRQRLKMRFLIMLVQSKRPDFNTLIRDIKNKIGNTTDLFKKTDLDPPVTKSVNEYCVATKNGKTTALDYSNTDKIKIKENNKMINALNY